MKLLRVKGWWDCDYSWNGSWLYLAVFPDRLKIGITNQPHARFSSLPSQGGYAMDAAEDIYLVDLPFGENRRRETLIKQCFGEVNEKRRHGEWLALEHFALALRFMLHPEDAEAFLRVRLVSQMEPLTHRFKDIGTHRRPFRRAA